MLNQNFVIEAHYSIENQATDYVVRFRLPEYEMSRARSRPVNDDAIVRYLEAHMQKAWDDVLRTVYKGDPL